MKYSVKCNVKIRIPVPDNKTGYGWRKQPDIILEGDSIEELTEKAYQIRPPEEIETEAIHIEGSLYLDGENMPRPNRKVVRIEAFKQL